MQGGEEKHVADINQKEVYLADEWSHSQHLTYFYKLASARDLTDMEKKNRRHHLCKIIEKGLDWREENGQL